MSFLEQLLGGVNAYFQKMLQLEELRNKMAWDLERTREYYEERRRQEALRRRQDEDYYGNLAYNYGTLIANDVVREFLQEIHEALGVGEGAIKEGGLTKEDLKSLPSNWAQFVHQMVVGETDPEKRRAMEGLAAKTPHIQRYREAQRRLLSLSPAELQRRIRQRIEQDFIQRGYDISLPSVQFAIQRITQEALQKASEVLGELRKSGAISEHTADALSAFGLPRTPSSPHPQTPAPQAPSTSPPSPRQPTPQGGVPQPVAPKTNTAPRPSKPSEGGGQPKGGKKSSKPKQQRKAQTGVQLAIANILENIRRAG